MKRYLFLKLGLTILVYSAASPRSQVSENVAVNRNNKQNNSPINSTQVAFAGQRGDGKNSLQDYQGVMGKPGVDFPVLTYIPRTKFICRGKKSGYYADLETNCQVFHICDEGRKVSFLCPNGTIFQQSDLICDWWFKVDCAIAPTLYDESAEQLYEENLRRKENRKVLQQERRTQKPNQQINNGQQSREFGKGRKPNAPRENFNSFAKKDISQYTSNQGNFGQVDNSRTDYSHFKETQIPSETASFVSGRYNSDQKNFYKGQNDVKDTTQNFLSSPKSYITGAFDAVKPATEKLNPRGGRTFSSGFSGFTTGKVQYRNQVPDLVKTTTQHTIYSPTVPPFTSTKHTTRRPTTLPIPPTTVPFHQKVSANRPISGFYITKQLNPATTASSVGSPVLTTRVPSAFAKSPPEVSSRILQNNNAFTSPPSATSISFPPIIVTTPLALVDRSNSFRRQFTTTLPVVTTQPSARANSFFHQDTTLPLEVTTNPPTVKSQEVTLFPPQAPTTKFARTNSFFQEATTLSPPFTNNPSKSETNVFHQSQVVTDPSRAKSLDIFQKVTTFAPQTLATKSVATNSFIPEATTLSPPFTNTPYDSEKNVFTEAYDSHQRKSFRSQERTNAFNSPGGTYDLTNAFTSSRGTNAFRSPGGTSAAFTSPAGTNGFTSPGTTNLPFTNPTNPTTLQPTIQPIPEVLQRGGPLHTTPASVDRTYRPLVASEIIAGSDKNTNSSSKIEAPFTDNQQINARFNKNPDPTSRINGQVNDPFSGDLQTTTDFIPTTRKTKISNPSRISSFINDPFSDNHDTTTDFLPTTRRPKLLDTTESIPVSENFPTTSIYEETTVRNSVVPSVPTPFRLRSETSPEGGEPTTNKFNKYTYLPKVQKTVPTPRPTPPTDYSFVTQPPVTDNISNMIKTLQILDGDNSSSLEEKFLEPRPGLHIPPSAGPKTLHSLAIYFATALDNLVSPNDTDHDKQYGSENVEASTVSATSDDSQVTLFTRTTQDKYNSLFDDLDDSPQNNTHDVRASKEDVDLKSLLEHDAEYNDLDSQQSQGPVSSTPRIRQLAQVFTQALSAYLDDPDTFKKVLEEIRPTEPPLLNDGSLNNGTPNYGTLNVGTSIPDNDIPNVGTGTPNLGTDSTPAPTSPTLAFTTEYKSYTKEEDEVLDFSDVDKSSTYRPFTDNNLKSGQPFLAPTTLSPRPFNQVSTHLPLHPAPTKLPPTPNQISTHLPQPTVPTKHPLISNQASTHLPPGPTSTKLIPTPNPLALDLNLKLKLSTPSSLQDLESLDDFTTENSEESEGQDYFPFNNGEDLEEVLRRATANPYGHGVKPANSTPISIPFSRFTTFRPETTTAEEIDKPSPFNSLLPPFKVSLNYREEINSSAVNEEYLQSSHSQSFVSHRNSIASERGGKNLKLETFETTVPTTTDISGDFSTTTNAPYRELDKEEFLTTTTVKTTTTYDLETTTPQVYSTTEFDSSTPKVYTNRQIITEETTETPTSTTTDPTTEHTTLPPELTTVAKPVPENHWSKSPEVTKLWETTLYVNPIIINRNLGPTNTDPSITEDTTSDPVTTYRPETTTQFAQTSTDPYDDSSFVELKLTTTESAFTFSTIPPIFSGLSTSSASSTSFRSSASLGSLASLGSSTSSDSSGSTSSSPASLSAANPQATIIDLGIHTLLNSTEMEIASSQAQQIFGNLKSTEQDLLIEKMKEAESNSTVRRLILLLISTCDASLNNNKTVQETRNSILSALLSIPPNNKVHETQNGDLSFRSGKQLSSDDRKETTLHYTTPLPETTSFPEAFSNNKRSAIVSTVEGPNKTLHVKDVNQDTRALELLRSLYSLAAKWGKK